MPTFAPPKKVSMYMRTIIRLLLWFPLLVSCGKGTPAQKPAVRVATEVASVTSDAKGRTYVGVVEEREATAVSFTSMGVIRRVYVGEGQAVSRGQLLAELDPSTSGNMLDAAQASTSQAQDMVAQMQSTYNQAKDAYDRMKILHDNGSLPEIKWIEAETRLRQAETALQSAKSGVRSASASERIARKSVADTRLYAPVSGVVGRMFLGAGETAMPSRPVANILDVSSVKVKVSVPEAEMPAIRPDMASTVTVAAAGVRIQGGHIEKGVQADALTHTYDVRINVQNPQRKLMPGMVADVQFDGGSSTLEGHRLLVPVRCVQRRADGSLFVWTIDNGSIAHRTPVTLGTTLGNRVEILSGIVEGQRFIVEGYQKVSEGSRVTF